MQVKLNDIETYQIDIKDKLTREEFITLVQRLQTISRAFFKDDFVQDMPSKVTTIHRNYSKTNLNKLSREQLMELYKVWFNGDENAFQVACKELNVLNQYLSTFGGNVKKFLVKHDITPHDLGIKRFTTFGDTLTNRQKLKL